MKALSAFAPKTTLAGTERFPMADTDQTATADQIGRRARRPGEIVYFPQGSYTGYLPCDGSTYLQSAYPTLFAAIGAVPDYAIDSFAVIAASATNVLSIVSGAGLYAAVITGTGAGIYTATDPQGMWTLRLPGTFLSLAWSGSLFVVTGSNVLQTSPDALTWTNQTSPYAGNMFVAAAGGVFSLECADNSFRTSTDGINYTTRTLPTTYGTGVGGVGNLNFAYGAGVHVKGGNGGVFWSADNCVTWNLGTWSLTSPLSALNMLRIAFGNGMFIGQGSGGKLMTSTDGKTWTDVRRRIGSVYGVSLVFAWLWDGEDWINYTSTTAILRSRDNFASASQLTLPSVPAAGLTVGGGAAIPVHANGLILAPGSSNAGPGLRVLTKYSYDKTTRFVVPNLANFGGFNNTLPYIATGDA